MTTLLIDKYPQIRKQFSRLNKGVNLYKLTTGSRQKIVWICPSGPDHVWEASPNQRTSGGSLRGCPICAGKKVVKSNSLCVEYPSISKEWDTELNDSLIPEKITSGSNIKVWWKCSRYQNHRWQASPKQRTKQNNLCPFCNSLKIQYPQVAKEWHPIKNGRLTPLDIAPSSHKKVWWKCSEGADHVWEATPNSRTSMQTGCPICAGYRVVKSNCLATVFPEIAIQWHYTKNVSATPEDIYCRSTKKVWWKCSEGADHVWQATIKSRASGIGCPICSGRKVVKSNSLAIRYPDISILWHPTKNSRTPFQMTPFSSYVAWWKCPENNTHEWESTVANIVNGSSCPVCINRKINADNNLCALFPDLMQEWDYQKNTEIDPSKISSGSKVRVWWVCKRDTEHVWYSAIRDRTQKDSGCPFCANKMNVSEHKMLEFIKEIFKEHEVKYCYRPEWLERLEIDVYLPQIQLGFEYQGIQHFKPIDFFGGEETYVAQVKRDKLKKDICDKRGITLLYIYYDEKLSKELIREKIINAGIDI